MGIMRESVQEITTSALKISPPVGVVGLHLGGLSIADWVSIATIVYVALQIGLLIPRYVEKIRAWRKGGNDES